MALRFRRRIRITPGVHINLGLHGAGLSVGPRGFHVGMNRCGMYTSAGMPGTGLYAVHHFRGPSDEHPNVQGTAAGFAVGILIAVGLFIVLAVAASSSIKTTIDRRARSGWTLGGIWPIFGR